MAMIRIHHLGISQSERIPWLCEELGLDYELVSYQRDATTRGAPDSFRALHPMGIAPVVEVDGRTIGESGAIAEYLANRHGDGRLTVASDAENYADYLYWLHFANATLMAIEIADIVKLMVGTEGPQDATAVLDRRRPAAYAMMEDRLSEADYFAGDELTLADIMMFFPLTTMRAFANRPLGDYPAIAAYLKRVGERPAYARAMEKCEPDLTPMLD